MEFKKYIILTKDLHFTSFKIQLKTGLTATSMTEQLTDTWISKPTDRLYFFPGCTIPRFKIREKYNTTIKPDYATAAFIAPNVIKESTMFNIMPSMSSIDGAILGNWLTSIYGETHHFVLKYKSLLLNREDLVLIETELRHLIYYSCPKDALFPETLRQWFAKCMPISEWDALGDLFNFIVLPTDSIFNSLKCPIYNQTDILKIINNDSVVIDAKRYKELCLMAESSDTENIILVMELMANADYGKSFIYLLLLLKKFASAIIKRKKEIDHVNFKALLNYLYLTKHNLSDLTIEIFVTSMKKNKQFTRTNVQQLSQLYATNNTHVNYDTKHFVKGPVLRQEIEDQLDDFIIQDNDEIIIEEDNFNL